MASIQLGPFLVDRPIGSGGMGSVWAGVHVEQGVPVAIKVINVDQGRRRAYLRAFRNEVRAVAGLDHPGVVMVFDHGQIPEGVEGPSGGRMVAGSPYLVMERASGGALDEVGSANTWEELKEVLFVLLDALGHAHARGVVHRDLKPGNVLVCTDEDLRPGLKLADFGLSHAGELQGSGQSSYSGTPRYMAPEQFNGRWRDYGPWTDLYALGCMAFEQVAGRSPFVGEEYAQLRQGHLYADPPGLGASPAVPGGFESWLLRLLEKDPGQRFQCAADAAWALWRLADPADPQATLAVLKPRNRNRTASFTMDFDGGSIGALRADSATQHFYEDLPGFGGPMEEPSIPEVSGPNARAAPVEVPPMPRDWRRPELAHGIELVGTGLGLFGLRRIPLVGRDAERDAIWQALGQVRESGQPQTLVFRGAGGVGKSRLVEWMVERTRELGAARLFKATHSPTEGPRDGLAGLLARHFECAGLSRDDTLKRVERALRAQGVSDPYEWHALTEMMVPLGAKDTADRIVAFSRPSERYVLVRRLMQGLDRPVVIWLDDVQWGADALRFAQDLMAAQDTPALLLLTCREDTEVPLGTLHELPRLAADEHRQLVQELLMLEGEVARQVQDRTGGNPLFAVQLVGDWVQRGILLPGPKGFLLEPGANLDIPDDLHQLWGTRLASLGAGAEEVALELAALLGVTVDEQEWRVALASGGWQVPEGLQEQLVDRQLAEALPNGGWRFSHQLMRESLVRRAREQGRTSALHQACARMLGSLYAADQRGVPARLGAHLMGAGLLLQALDPLLAGAEQHLASSDYGPANELLDQRDALVQRLALGGHDPRVGQGQLLRARVLAGQGRYADGARLSQQVARDAEHNAWLELFPQALLAAAQCASRQGQLEASAELARAGVREAQVLGDRVHEARGRRLLALGEQRSGAYGEALRLGREAFELSRSAGDLRGQADALVLVAACEAASDRPDRAALLLRRAVELFEACGSQYGIASTYNNLADLLRKDGDPQGAEAGFRQALTTFRRVGSPDAVIPLLNLAILLTERDEHAPAREHLRAGLRLADQSGNGILSGFAHALSLPSAAALQSWGRWSDHVAGARTLTAAGVFDPDVAAALQRAGIEAARRERWTEAKEVLALSRAHWQGLGRQWEVDRVQKALDAIG